MIDPRLIPPESLRLWVGPFAKEADYTRSAEDSLKVLVEVGGLSPSDAILDLGCGCGRVASALTSFLQTAGSYDGLDLAAAVISWCQENISPRFPKFRFGLVDVQNAAYNPAGKLPVSLVVLPFAAGTFDFVIASSFFTHLLAPEAEHYFSEVSRVLRPAGTLVATFFVLDAESSGAVTNQRTTFDFRHRIGPCSTFDPHTPESGVAYDESYLLEVLRRFEFSLRRPIQHGSWRSERGYLTTHDVVVARRSAA